MIPVQNLGALSIKLPENLCTLLDCNQYYGNFHNLKSFFHRKSFEF